MKQVNNKNGIKMFWEFSNDEYKTINILDSNGNYFDDQYYDDEDDFGAIIIVSINQRIELIEHYRQDENKDEFLVELYTRDIKEIRTIMNKLADAKIV